MKELNHVAIIMDGNGRWAKARGHNRIFGHVRGMKTVRSIVETACSLNLKNLSLFALSNENWNRPKFEISGLMKILKKFLKSELNFLIKNNIKLTTIGELSRLPEDIQKLISEVKLATLGNSGLNLCLALSYGSQQEIVEAAKKMCSDVQSSKLDIDSIDEEKFSSYLQTSNKPNPDLLIRTSGENRISNFLLFQSAYSEIYFSNTLWPDFSNQEFVEILDWYQQRERRFGMTSEQINGETTNELTQN